MWVEHPLIKPQKVEAREYQLNIASSCLRGNTLIVLGTGLGKTIIVTLVIAEVLYRKKGKVLFLAPTKPLVEQHHRTLVDLLNLDKDKIVMFTGEVSRNKREAMWKDAIIIVSTPQVIENDIKDGIADISNLSLAVFDEAHRAVGRYSYVFIAESLSNDTLIIGTTASPGWSEERIMEVVKNLRIENIEIRTENDPDVRKYVNPIKIKVVRVKMPEELTEIYDELRKLYEEIVEKLKNEYSIFSSKKVKKRDILEAQKLVEAEIASGRKELYNALTLLTAAIKIDYAIEHLETQGFRSFMSFLEKIVAEGNDKSGSKAARMLIFNSRFIRAYNKAKEFAKKCEDNNPKLARLCEILRNFLEEHPEAKVIVFTQYRDTARLIVETLNKQSGIRAERFVGQANREGDKGLTQKEQLEIIDRFKSGLCNVLVATSVGEEGLDIPQVDLVIFYEAVPSEIRAIQRRGRTGRRRIGHVFVLTTERTRDEAYLFASKIKELRMKKRLERLRELLSASAEKRNIKAEELTVKSISLSSIPASVEQSEPVPINPDTSPQSVDTAASNPVPPEKQKKKGQLSLIDFFTDNRGQGSITVDVREASSEVTKYLLQRGIPMNVGNLDCGDYTISDKIVVERVRVEELASSEVDSQIFQRIRSIKNRYSVGVLIIEGVVDTSNSNREALLNLMVSLIIDFRISIVYSRDARETAEIIEALAKRELQGMMKIYNKESEKDSNKVVESEAIVDKSKKVISASISDHVKLKDVGGISYEVSH